MSFLSFVGVSHVDIGSYLKDKVKHSIKSSDQSTPSLSNTKDKSDATPILNEKITYTARFKKDF